MRSYKGKISGGVLLLLLLGFARVAVSLVWVKRQNINLYLFATTHIVASSITQFASFYVHYTIHTYALHSVSTRAHLAANLSCLPRIQHVFSGITTAARYRNALVDSLHPFTPTCNKPRHPMADLDQPHEVPVPRVRRVCHNE